MLESLFVRVHRPTPRSVPFAECMCFSEHVPLSLARNGRALGRNISQVVLRVTHVRVWVILIVC